MDLSSLEPWLKLTHVLGVVLFVAGHGVSMYVFFHVRRETEPDRMRILLDASSASFPLMGIGLLLLIVGGILGGFAGGYWGQGWLTLSIVLLVVIFGAMTPMAAIPLGNLRRALGMRTRELKADQPAPEALPNGEVVAMAAALRPDRALAVGGIGFVAILALMVLKPF